MRPTDPAIVAEARRMRAGDMTLSEIGADLGLAVSTVSGLCADVRRSSRTGRPPKLSDEQVGQVRARRAAGVPVAEIASDAGISAAYVYVLCASSARPDAPGPRLRVKAPPLSGAELEDIRRMLADGVPIADIMAWTGRSRGAVLRAGRT